MKIIVTGALGHIGSRLIRDIPAKFPGVEIIMIDNLSTQRYCSLFNLPKNGKYRFIEEDVLSADLLPIFSGADVIVHLAAITNAAGSYEISKQVERVNYEGTNKVAVAALEAECPMIFLSTTSVYGTQAEIVNENCPASDLKPQSPYAESKLKAEQMLEDLGKSKGLRFVVCRFGTIFGVSIGMRFHTAVNKFCWQAALGQPITVWRTAIHQFRPYLDLSDAMEALKFIMVKGLYDRRIYNVLTENLTVNDILNTIALHIPDLAIQYVDTKIMNQMSYHVSNERFKNVGFKFIGSIKQGIADTIDLLRGVRKW